MNRRGFFGWLVGFIAALVGTRAVATNSKGPLLLKPDVAKYEIDHAGRLHFVRRGKVCIAAAALPDTSFPPPPPGFRRTVYERVASHTRQGWLIVWYTVDQERL
jgi:hypothetical protein